MLEQPVTADDDGARRELALGPEARQRFDAIDWRQREAIGRGTLHDRAADWMFGAALERGGERENLGRLRAVERHDIGDAQTPIGQRPGLVERHTSDTPRDARASRPP